MCSLAVHFCLSSVQGTHLVVSPASLVHIGTWSSMLPSSTWPGSLTLKLLGNRHHYVNRTQGSSCSMGNRRHKPASSLPPEAVMLKCSSWSPCGKPGSRTPVACGLGSPQLSKQQHHRTVLSKACAGIRPQDSYCPKVWFPCACRSCCGFM
jgi:hypothetical protein